MLIVSFAWGLWSWSEGARRPAPMQTVAQVQVGQLRIEVAVEGDNFRDGQNRFRVFVRQPTGEPAEIENLRVQFYMPAMGSMAPMQAGADVVQAGSGEVEGAVDLPMSGEWQMRVSFDTSQGSQNTQISIRAQ